MKRYISRVTKILFFIILVIIADRVIGLILRQLYFHQHTGPMHALTYALKECNTDILILGASQAQHDYVPSIISDSLNMSCYNAGLDGGYSDILQYAEILEITKRYKPKMILFDFRPENIVFYPGDYDRLNILLPYYRDYIDLRPFVLLRSPYEKVKLISAIYPFNSTVIDVIRYNTHTHAARVKDIKGYIPLKEVMNNSMYKTEPEFGYQAVVDSIKVNALRKIISLCNEKGIYLYIISSPIFRDAMDRQRYPLSEAKLSMEIMKKEKANYLDFSFDSTFSDHMEWFTDQNHLNAVGANIFTEKLTIALKEFKEPHLE